MAEDKDLAMMIEKSEGKEAMSERLARAAVAQGEIEAMKKTLREEYRGFFHDLSVGRRPACHPGRSTASRSSSAT